MGPRLSASAETESRARVARLVEAFASAPWKLGASEVDAEAGTSGSSALPVDDSSVAITLLEPAVEAPLWNTYPVLLYRSYLNNIRQGALIGARLGQGLFFGLILCLFYAPIHWSQQGVQDIIGLLYETTALVFVGMLNNASI